MSLVYHRVPENMTGDMLYPMNRLHEVSDELHKLYKEGYEGREKLLNRKIPYLDCLWNDVLHCLPVHPETVIKAMKEEGLKNIQIAKFSFFEINTVKDIEIKKSVVYFRNSSSKIEFKRASKVDLNQLNFVPELTRQHYRDVLKTGEALFPYHGVPHFLYMGTVDIRELRVIKPDIKNI